jgi:hypothetical protein
VAEAAATSAPQDPGAGLGEHEVKAILDYKKKHPSMGPAQNPCRCASQNIQYVMSGSVRSASLPSGPDRASTKSPFACSTSASAHERSVRSNAQALVDAGIGRMELSREKHARVVGAW